MLFAAEVCDEGLGVEHGEACGYLGAQVVRDAQSAPNFKHPIEPFDLFEVPMAELNFAFGALAELLTLLLASYLILDTFGAENVPTWQPFGVLVEYVPADGTLELLIQRFVLVGRKRDSNVIRACFPSASILALTLPAADNRLTGLLQLRTCLH